jgi:hypothetical protein
MSLHCVEVDIGSGLLVIRNASMKTRFEIKMETSEMQRVYLNAADACTAYLEPIPGLMNCFRSYLADSSTATGVVDFYAAAMGGASHGFDGDNPGHLFLAMRGLVGVDMNRGSTAYVKAIAAALSARLDVQMDRERVFAVHAHVCRALGACLCAPPRPGTPILTTGIDPVACLCEMAFSIAPSVTGSSRDMTPENKAQVVAEFRAWTAPEEISDRLPKAASRWSLERADERVVAMMAITTKQQ